MTIKTIDEHAYEIVTEEGTFAVCKDTLAKFDTTKHEHGVAACGRCGCCFTGDCCDGTDCEHNHTEECEGKACPHACHENREGHECAFCHLAFDTNEKCHDEILADLKELKAELAARVLGFRFLLRIGSSQGGEPNPDTNHRAYRMMSTGAVVLFFSMMAQICSGVSLQLRRIHSQIIDETAETRISSA